VGHEKPCEMLKSFRRVLSFSSLFLGMLRGCDYISIQNNNNSLSIREGINFFMYKGRH
jgi:hypothetical protein